MNDQWAECLFAKPPEKRVEVLIDQSALFWLVGLLFAFAGSERRERERERGDCPVCVFSFVISNVAHLHPRTYTNRR